MHLTGLKLLAAGAITLALSACVPGEFPMTTTVSGSASPTASGAPALVPNAYAAQTDNGFAIPALPTEQIPVQFQRQTVAYPNTQAPGTIIINPAEKVLYYVTGPKTALRYGIAVGRAGFEWSGEAVVTEKKLWPTWTPPKEMIARKPELAKWEHGQPGGTTNPLGARAIYLTTNGVDYGYRIHGTPEWESIGRNASSGCIRMINQDVIDLFSRVQGGEKVIVLTAAGEFPTRLTLPPPPPKPKVAAPAPVATPAPAAEPPVDILPPPVAPAPVDLTI